MNTNDIKIMFRNIWRNKVYSIINILGLSIGIAAIIWGIQNYRYAVSFDDFQSQKEVIYRILSKHETRENILGITPFPVAKQAAQEFSSIKEYNRLLSRWADLKTDQAEAFTARIHFTDPSFFRMFDFPLLKGSNNIEQPASIVLTEKAAKKYFGNEDPIGKTVTLYSAEAFRMPVTVIGILKDHPQNSTIQFEAISELNNFRSPDGKKLAEEDWGYFADASFIKITDPAAAARMDEQLKRYIAHQNDVRKDYKLSAFEVLPMSKIARLNNRAIDSNELRTAPDDSATLGPLVLAILILLSACLNFANTTVARSNKRLKEIGIRKVMGSTKRRIIIQQLFECAFVVLVAMLISTAINNWWLPEFNAMFAFASAKAEYFSDQTLQIILLLVLLIVTIVAGMYPAFYVSRYNPTEIFRGSVKFGGRNLFSMILLGLQIVIAFITVIASAGFYRNAIFQRDFDYGYAKNNLFGIFLNDSTQYKSLYNEISKIPGVQSVAGTRHHIGFSYRHITAEALGQKKESIFMSVSPEYIKTMQLKLKDGRLLDAEHEGDYQNAMLITEKLAFQYGWKGEEALGKNISFDTSVYTVKGVLKDFHINSLFSPLEPIAINIVKPEKYQELIIQTRPGQLHSVYDQSRASWKKLYPMKPYNAFYQDEISEEATKINESIAKIFFWFAIVSILLTSTGFFALISLTLLKKMREIAIRKVVGASLKDIVVIMNKGYFWVFIVATLIGCFTGITLTRLMMDSIFRINIGINISTAWIAFFVMLTITAATIAIKVREAMVTKPVDVLKAE
ncbi:ABC transporter permease [Pollutibacter soli]|uniref:ABC transporter permease n=1 Tax=Pollutibacter soli TaxID=3034157 RepID=UPI00301332E1